MIFNLRSEAPALFVNDWRRFVDDDLVAGDVAGSVAVDAVDVVCASITGSEVHSVDALEQHEAELKASAGLWRRGDVIVGDGLGISGLVVEDGLQQVTDANELFFELCVSLALPPQADRILKARACF